MRGVRTAARFPETYALLLAGWYTLFLTLGIPTLPPAGHVAAALLFVGCLVGAAIATARLNISRSRRSAVRLGVGFLGFAAATSLVVGGTDLSVRAVMKGSFAGRLLVAGTGATLFVGAVVALVMAGRMAVAHRPRLD